MVTFGLDRWRNCALALMLFLVLLTGTAYVAMPYRTANFMGDDVYWLVQIGLLSSHESGLNWWTYLVGDGEHSYPIWKALYFLIWRLFGALPEYWRYFIWAAHALSACLAFQLVSSQLGSALGALIGAGLWATNPVCGFESPLLWTSCGFYPICLSFWLGAMICLQRSQADGAARSWVWLMAGCILGAVLTWNVTVVWLPLLPLQYFFLDCQPARASFWRQRWFWMWLAACVVAGAYFLLREQAAGASTSEARISLDVLRNEAFLLAFAVGRVLFRPDLPGTERLLFDSCALITILAALTFLPFRHRRLAALLLGLGATQGLAVALFRPGAEMEQSRYLYYCTFGVTLCLAIVIDWFVKPITGHWRVGVYGLSVAGIILLADGQRAGAQQARKLANDSTSALKGMLDSYQQLLEDIALQANHRSQTMRLIDVPLVLPEPFPAAFLPLRGYIFATARHHDDHIRLVPADQITDQDIAMTTSVVSSTTQLGAQLWKNALHRVMPDITLLAWLSGLCESEGRDVSIPNVTWSYPKARVVFSMDVCNRLAFSHPLRHVRVSNQLTDSEASALRELLYRNQSEQSAILLRLLGLETSDATR